MSKYFKQQRDQQPQQSQIEVLRSELKERLGKAAENQNSKRHRYVQKISALKQKQESCIGGRHPEHYQMFQSKIKELEEKLQNVDEKGRSTIDFQITYDGLLQQFSQIEGLDPFNLEGQIRNDNFTILCSIKRQAFNLQKQFQQRKFLSLLNVLIEATTLLIEKYKKAGVVVQFDMEKEEIQQILNSVEQHREMRQRQKEERKRERKKLERDDNFEDKQGKQFEEDQFVKQKISKYDQRKQQYPPEEQQPFYQNYYQNQEQPQQYQNQEQPQQYQNKRQQRQERQDKQDRQEKQSRQNRPEIKDRKDRQERQNRDDRQDRQDRIDRKVDKQDRYARQDRQDRDRQYEAKIDQNLKQDFASQQIPKQEPFQEKQQQQELEKKPSELQTVIDQLNQKLQIKEEQNRKLSEQQQMEKKKQEQQEENLCQICFNNKREYVAVPCGHFVYCGDCKNLVKKECLICRSPCTQLLRIFT